MERRGHRVTRRQRPRARGLRPDHHDRVHHDDVYHTPVDHHDDCRVAAAEPPPADPYANVPVNQIGTILIPKIGFVHPIFEGVWLTVVDHGPGHWPGSAEPGQIGNSVFAGHRVTHTHPFLNLDQLAVGDQVVFDMPYGVFTYAVTSITIVLPTDIGITDPTRTPPISVRLQSEAQRGPADRREGKAHKLGAQVAGTQGDAPEVRAGTTRRPYPRSHRAQTDRSCHRCVVRNR